MGSAFDRALERLQKYYGIIGDFEFGLRFLGNLQPNQWDIEAVSDLIGIHGTATDVWVEEGVTRVVVFAQTREAIVDDLRRTLEELELPFDLELHEVGEDGHGPVLCWRIPPSR